ncbi:titin [Culex quinquefasciatus]|uniref:titin n=1 Tax=Culex quinquefasciatus TaxID=7176 RepID=UPI0018E3B388|nr:titin [Culex quinquefasciatus]
MSSGDTSGSKEPVPKKEPTEPPLPPGWARIASKKRPGKHYYFNAASNTSLWEHPARALAQEAKIVANVGAAKKKKAKDGEKKVVQLRNDTQFKKKNLAKLRMESIRTQQDEERKTVVKKTASPRRKPEVKVTSSPKKKPEVPVKKPEKPEVKKVASPKKVAPKKQEVVKTSPRQKRKLTEDSPKSAKKKPAEASKTSAKSHAIAKKTSPVKAKPKTVLAIKKEVESLKQFKIPKKPPEVEPVPSPVLVDIRKLEEVKPEVPVETPKSIPVVVPAVSPKPCLEPSPRSHSTPKVAAVPQDSFTKSPANDRLAQLRNQIAQNVELDEDAEMTDLSVDNSTLEVEEMEWEDIPEEVALQEVVTIRRSLGLKLAGSGQTPSIPDHQSHQEDQVSSSFQRFFFVVVDTNIFLSHLKPLETLLTTGIPSVGQPILIIPYIVLQELDRIKHREAGRPLSQAACRSIRFLNDLLKRRDPRIRGQSTIEAAAPIIPIENPDDHIVNCCCQQLGQVRAELFLLSNDVNLRNKALVSGLTAVSFGELMAEAERLRKVAASAASG